MIYSVQEAIETANRILAGIGCEIVATKGAESKTGYTVTATVKFELDGERIAGAPEGWKPGQRAEDGPPNKL